MLCNSDKHEGTKRRGHQLTHCKRTHLITANNTINALGLYLMNKFLENLGDAGMIAFALFVLAILATNYSDKNMGTAIKQSAPYSVTRNK